VCGQDRADDRGEGQRVLPGLLGTVLRLLCDQGMLDDVLIYPARGDLQGFFRRSRSGSGYWRATSRPGALIRAGSAGTSRSRWTGPMDGAATLVDVCHAPRHARACRPSKESYLAANCPGDDDGEVAARLINRLAARGVDGITIDADYPRHPVSGYLPELGDVALACAVGGAGHRCIGARTVAICGSGRRLGPRDKRGEPRGREARPMDRHSIVQAPLRPTRRRTAAGVWLLGRGRAGRRRGGR